MKLKEDQFSRQVIYEGKIFSVYHDLVRLPNDQEAYRDVVTHHGGVAIAAKNASGEYFMVRQYRYPLNKEMTEFVAGKKEKGEDPLTTAKRELIEETGYQAENFEYLGRFIPTCGYCNEHIDMYYADQLTFIGQQLDDIEFLNVFTIRLEELIRQIMNNEIEDAKTIIMALKLQYLQK
ncbi:MAG: NUDIX hydrolase [Erysipelotrichaceae bacterium]|nr:NUDIX hydrolase [Erysipelotrichaceae bacterium]